MGSDMSDVFEDQKALASALSEPCAKKSVILYHSYADIDFLLPDNKEITITQVRRITITEIYGGISALMIEQNNGILLVVPPIYRFMTFRLTEITP